MLQAIDSINGCMASLSVILADPAVRTAVEARIIEMARAKTRAEQQQTAPAAPAESQPMYGLLEKRGDGRAKSGCRGCLLRRCYGI